MVNKHTVNNHPSPSQLSVHFYSSPQAERNYPFIPNSVFSRSIFSPEEGGGEDYGFEKMTKTKPTRVLVTSFDKFHHFCTFTFLVSVFCSII